MGHALNLSTHFGGFGFYVQRMKFRGISCFWKLFQNALRLITIWRNINTSLINVISPFKLSRSRLRPSQRPWRPKRLCLRVYTARGRRRSGLLPPSVAPKPFVCAGSPSIPARVLLAGTSEYSDCWEVQGLHLVLNDGQCVIQTYALKYTFTSWQAKACLYRDIKCMNIFLLQAGSLCHHQVPLDHRVRHEENWGQQHTCVHCGCQGKQTPDQTRSQEAVWHRCRQSQHTHQVRNLNQAEHYLDNWNDGPNVH